MNMKRRFLHAVVRQFHRPTGAAGHVVGWVMARRTSNVHRSRWAVGLLEVGPSERVIELGCGPGVAVAALADRARGGMVVGVDHSAVMIRQARRRNAEAVRTGRVQLVQRPVEELGRAEGGFGVPFDAALAVNTVGFWPDPPARLRDIGAMLRPGGRIALVAQPRCPGATAETSVAAGDELVALLVGAGFGNIRRETLDLDPPAVCVLAERLRHAT